MGIVLLTLALSRSEAFDTLKVHRECDRTRPSLHQEIQILILVVPTRSRYLREGGSGSLGLVVEIRSVSETVEHLEGGMAA